MLSIIIPCFNEEKTIKTIIEKVLKAEPLEKQIILIDDGSTDNSPKIIKQFQHKSISIISKDKNMGKGAAIQTGLSQVLGDWVIIQDADLEYNPDEYIHLIHAGEEQNADAVYGSRFLKTPPRSIIDWINKGLTWISNHLSGLHLTDMETCYKLIRCDIANKLNLQENRFGIEPEITARLAQLNAKIIEVQISYQRRPYKHGKKIGFKDGCRTIWCIFKYNI